MNLFLIKFTNPNGVGYEYFVYADTIEFNQVGNGVQFITNGDVIRIIGLYNSVMKLSDEQFNEKYKEFFIKYPMVTKKSFIESTNQAPERYNYM